MRTLKYVILGLLNRKPMTGYDIAKEFNFQLAEFWSANHSQIYPELKKLVDEELLVFDIEITGDILEKKVYKITERGRKDFNKWLNRDEPMEPTPKNVFRLRMYFSDGIQVETRIRLLEHQLLQHQKRHAFLCSQKVKYSSVPPLNSEEFGDYIVIESAILREESTIKWLENCIGYCKK